MAEFVRQLQAVLFDLDDTLFDHQHCSRSGLSVLQTQHACLQTKTITQLEHEHLRLLNETHLQVMAGKLSLDQARLKRFRSLFAWCGQNISVETAQAASSAYRQAYAAARRAVPGAEPLLNTLRTRSIKIAVVTNHVAVEQREKLRACELDQLVDALIVSEDVGVAKPDCAIFVAALDAVGCKVDAAAMVGDAWQADVEGAHGAGIHRVIWLNRYGLTCPDPALAAEIVSLEPVEQVIGLLCNSHVP